jgi:hypothetical protein
MPKSGKTACWRFSNGYGSERRRSGWDRRQFGATATSASASARRSIKPGRRRALTLAIAHDGATLDQYSWGAKPAGVAPAMAPEVRIDQDKPIDWHVASGKPNRNVLKREEHGWTVILSITFQDQCVNALATHPGCTLLRPRRPVHICYRRRIAVKCQASSSSSLITRMRSIP